MVELNSAWRLHPQVALRPEPFGALAYHFGTRRLSFLKTPKLVAVVDALGSVDDVQTAFDGASVTAEEAPAYVAALERLAASDMIVPAG